MPFFSGLLRTDAAQSLPAHLVFGAYRHPPTCNPYVN